MIRTRPSSRVYATSLMPICRSSRKCRSRMSVWPAARATPGFGPWERLGKILDHSEVPHHNPREHPDYERGIEGAQLVELPTGRVLLNATCFLPDGPRGTRQRVFFAIADQVEGPNQTLGPVLDPGEPGENGHSTVMVKDNEGFPRSAGNHR